MGNGETMCPATDQKCDVMTECAISRALLNDLTGRYADELKIVYGEKVGAVAGSTACSRLVEARLRQLIEGEETDQGVREEAQAALGMFAVN